MGQSSPDEKSAAARAGMSPQKFRDFPQKAASAHDGLPRRSYSNLTFSQRARTSTSPKLRASTSTLCPGLVVPRNNECVLAIPAFIAKEGARINIRDKSTAGATILRADISLPRWAPPTAETISNQNDQP